MAMLIMPDGSGNEVQPENGKTFALPQLYCLLDCKMIEIINLHDGDLMIVDEEGRLKPIEMQKFNFCASVVARHALGFSAERALTDEKCKIMGRALVIRATEID